MPWGIMYLNNSCRMGYLLKYSKTRLKRPINRLKKCCLIRHGFLIPNTLSFLVNHQMNHQATCKWVVSPVTADCCLIFLKCLWACMSSYSLNHPLPSPLKGSLQTDNGADTLSIGTLCLMIPYYHTGKSTQIY